MGGEREIEIEREWVAGILMGGVYGLGKVGGRGSERVWRRRMEDDADVCCRIQYSSYTPLLLSANCYPAF